MQECYKKIRENYRELRGIEDYSAAVGTVIVGFALLVQEEARSGVNFGLTKSAVLVENILGGIAGGIFYGKLLTRGRVSASIVMRTFL